MNEIKQETVNVQIIIQSVRAPASTDVKYTIVLKEPELSKTLDFFPGQEWFDTKAKKRYVFVGSKNGKAEWKLAKLSDASSEKPSDHIDDPTDLPTCISATTAILRAMEKAGLLSES